MIIVNLNIFIIMNYFTDNLNGARRPTNGDVLHLVLEFFSRAPASNNRKIHLLEVSRFPLEVHQRDLILPTKLHEIESTIESPRPERRHRMNLE